MTKYNAENVARNLAGDKEPYQKENGTWITTCPDHDDSNHSLMVCDTENGPIGICVAGCGRVDLTTVRMMQDA